MKTRIKAVAVILIPILILASANLVGYKNLDTLILAQDMILSRQIAKNLKSSDRHLAISSLSILAKRGNTSGLETAEDWLTDQHDWLHGALYLAEFKKDKSIPYLIRGLDHPFASGLYPEIHDKLVALTIQDLGTAKPPWIEWWRVSNPEQTFDFSTDHITIPDRRKPNKSEMATPRKPSD